MIKESHLQMVKVVVGIMAAIALGMYSYYTMRQSSYIFETPVTISVVGKGEVFAKPDIATFSFTVNAKEDDTITAQNKSAETMSAVVAYLKEAGVDEKDIKTASYSLAPRYENQEVVCTQWGCPPQQGEPKLIGYEVSQSVSVKIRDTKKAGEMLTGVGSKGALNVSGLTFTIDDENKLNAEAREKAIVDAQAQAKVLAQNLGKRLGRMTGYWEGQSGSQAYFDVSAVSMAKSDMSASEVSRSAEIPTGENTISTEVNITYELK